MENRKAPPGSLNGPLSESVLEALVSQHQTALLRYATRFLNSAAAAQDVVQEVFIKLARDWTPQACPVERLGFWLYRLAHNAAIDHIRHESRLRRLHQEHVEMQAADHGGNSPLDDDGKRNMVLANLNKLDPAERQILILRLQQGLSYRDISLITRRTQGNVGCILHHAVKKMSQTLKNQGVI